MFLKIDNGRYTCCDGVTRRSFLNAGALAFGGLTLNALLRGTARADEAARKDLSVILVWQGGGPSHLDMWDMKPDAPAEFRGPFSPIKTALPGYAVCEHLPRCAKIADKLAILRATTHADSGHESASHLLLTGYAASGENPAQEMPSSGSIAGKELGATAAGFPPYVAVPRAPRSARAGYIGVQHNPFETQGDPNQAGFTVRNLGTAGGVPLERLRTRRELLRKFDTLRRDADASGVIAGMDQFAQQAFELVTSPKVQDAFDIEKEPAATRDLYGRHTWGQSLLLSRRLIESGVRFVTVDMGGWDTHTNNFDDLKKKLPPFDAAFAALIEDLGRRGRLDSTLVLLWGEFGRTPKINSSAGRDHWSNVFTTVMAGGGLKRGALVGASDARGEYPKERPCSPQDVLATMYHQLGIDRSKTYRNEADRPVAILNQGAPIRELL
jgi:hypothetical protein